MLRIITYRDIDSPILFKKTGKITNFGKELKDFANAMEKTLFEADALGLAAPQVGRSVAICATRAKDDILFFCNPKVIQKSAQIEKAEEGCLSFPNIFLYVPRSKSIKVTYQDLDGNSKELQAEGLLARTLQHEIDHLNGIAFIEQT